MTSKPTRQPVEPLKTRHVFLDTEVYRRAAFNLRNSQFKVLSDYIKAGRLSLHYTDITLAEVNRQLLEDVEEKVARLNKLKRELGRMAQLCDDVPNLPDVDKETMGKSVSIGFLDVMVSELSGHPIHAMQIPARRIFEKYFMGLPPFAKRGSKEFPDAFIVEALGEYCAKNNLRMYAVSGDSAFREAAAQIPHLIPVSSLEDVLAACTAEAAIDLDATADDIFAAPNFDTQLIDAITADLSFAEGLYFGDLPDGQVRDIELHEIVAVDGYSLAAVDEHTISLILEVNCILRASVDWIYIDHDGVDPGDASYITPATDFSKAHSHLKVYVTVEIGTGVFKDSELLTKEVIFE